jgi:glycerate kinase
MGLRVLIVPDKFKGTLTSREAAEAVDRGWGKARPGDSLQLLPMSDGGDGFGEVMSGLLRAKPQRVETCDAAHRPCRARWWWEAKSRTAVIETAQVVGLAMLPRGRFHPFQLDTYGLGKVLSAAAARGARRCLVGIGGSATNDGGFGLARALGWKFFKETGEEAEDWTELALVNRLSPPRRQLRFRELVIAVDVQNPLLGPEGATRIYGPQKGLTPGDFDLAERCLQRLALLVRKQARRDVARTHGAGAAGGLGFGLTAFLRGRLAPGFELFAHEADLQRHLGEADVVVTGEGAIDHSTFMGKGAGQVALRCQQRGVPCIGLAGVISKGMANRKLFTQLHALTDLTNAATATKEPAKWLERLAKQVAEGWAI